jgi:hypothetical protein
MRRSVKLIKERGKRLSEPSRGAAIFPLPAWRAFPKEVLVMNEEVFQDWFWWSNFLAGKGRPSCLFPRHGLLFQDNQAEHIFLGFLRQGLRRRQQHFGKRPAAQGR